MCQAERLDVQGKQLTVEALLYAHLMHTKKTTRKLTNRLNEELIGFSESDCSSSESFKFLSSVKSSHEHRQRERKKNMNSQRWF